MPQNNPTRLEALEAEAERRLSVSDRQARAALTHDDVEDGDDDTDEVLSTSERQARLVTGAQS